VNPVKRIVLPFVPFVLFFAVKEASDELLAAFLAALSLWVQ
jgi:hypothetical protein